MNKVTKNLIWGFAVQILSLIFSIVLPRLIIVRFGSETNGITSTITQIFVYIALLESGIGSAALIRLYKNLADHDQNGISETVSATRNYYRKLLPLYIGCVLLLACFFTQAVDTTVPTQTVRFLIFIQGLCGVINFLFTNAYLQLLVADGRNYVVSLLTLVVKAVSFAGQILLISLGYSIVSVQLSALLAYIIQAAAIRLYVKKQYPWLAYQPDASISVLSQRKAFVIHEISGVVFQSTDLVLISVFCSITEASVYAVYSMIFSALGNIISILMRAFEHRMGEAYHRNPEEYIKLHDFLETLYGCFVFAVVFAAYRVTLPFVALYTEGVTDAQYVRPILPVLFALIQLFSCGRRVCAHLISIAGRAKDTIPNTLTEMIINLAASVLLVNTLGMVGVLIATIIALCYRTNDILFYANRKILNRRPWKAYRVFGLNMLLFVLTAAASSYLPLEIGSYFSFFIQGALTLVCSLVIYFGIHIALNPDFRRSLKALLFKA